MRNRRFVLSSAAVLAGGFLLAVRRSQAASPDRQPVTGAAETVRASMFPQNQQTWRYANRLLRA